MSDDIAVPLFERAQETAHYIQKNLPENLSQPKLAIICGSGLGGLADTVHASPRHEIPYSEIPHFPQPTGRYLILVVAAEMHLLIQ